MVKARKKQAWKAGKTSGFLALCAALTALNGFAAEDAKPANDAATSPATKAGPDAKTAEPAPANPQKETAPTDKTESQSSAAEPTKEGKAAEPEPPAQYNNWFDVSMGGILVDGDAPRFQHQQQFGKDAFGGVEDFHYERRLGKKSSIQVDGAGLYDQDHYKMTLEYVRQDVGFLRGGFSKDRVWYDGYGGFFPQNQRWFELFDNDLAMDRGKFWVEGGLLIPKWPEFRVKYEHDYRDGTKDSTIWGDTTLTGGAGVRSLVPSFLGVDERRDRFGVTMNHTVGKTDLEVGINLERDNNQDTLYVRSQPGEGGKNDQTISQQNGVDSGIFSTHASSVTRFNPNTMLATGYSFTALDSDLSGQRVYGASYDAVYDPTYQRRSTDVGFIGLNGGADLKQHVFSLNFMHSPVTNLFLAPSIRVEKRDMTSFSSFLATGPAEQEQSAWGNSADGLIEVSERLEARYNGVTNWVFYTRGDWAQGQGNLKEALANASPSPLVAPFDRDTDYYQNVQKYTAGANWYPLRRLNIDWQYYHKVSANTYDHLSDSTLNSGASSDRFPAYYVGQDFTTDDANVRTTIRALNNLTFVSRYDFQYSIIDTAPDQLSKVQSGQMFSHVFSQSVTWMPTSRLYLQPSINYVIDRTETPAADLGGGATGLVANSRNDYWTGSLMAGYALSEKDDLYAHYFFYRSGNYYDDSATTMPYDASATEHGVTLSLIHRFSERLRGIVKYGYFQNRDTTSGQHTDFNAHLIYSSLQYRF
jgi:hypothetical protein